MTISDCVTVNENPSCDNELTTKRYAGEFLHAVNVFRFNQTLDNYLKVSLGRDKKTSQDLIKKNELQRQDNKYRTH